MENAFLIFIGIIFIVCGGMIMGGKTQLIHSYHTKNITEENRKPYGRVVGAGVLIIGVGILLDGILSFFLDSTRLVTIVSLIVSIVLIFYGQLKYNKEIF